MLAAEIVRPGAFALSPRSIPLSVRHLHTRALVGCIRRIRRSSPSDRAEMHTQQFFHANERAMKKTSLQETAPQHPGSRGHPRAFRIRQRLGHACLNYGADAKSPLTEFCVLHRPFMFLSIDLVESNSVEIFHLPASAALGL